MAHGNALAFDPVTAAKTLAESRAVGCAANANATAPLTDQCGGGLIPGNGTYFTIPTRLTEVTLATDVFTTTGTIAGTLTIEVTNASSDDCDKALADWHTYDKVTTGGFTSGVATLAAGAITGGSNPGSVELKDVGFSAYRYKLIITSGTGTIRDRRNFKGL